MNLLKSVINVVKETAEEAMHTTPLEKALYNTTSNMNVIASVSDMELIAEHTNDYEDTKTIMKYIGKKLKRDNIKKALDLVEYLVKNGTMRVVLEIKEEKHQIKSLRKMLAGDDEMEFVELITKKCDTILEIIADEKRLEEERDQASQLRNRIKGTGNSRGYGGYGSYGSESYDAVGSDSRKKKQNDDPYRGYGSNSYGNRDRDRERERDRDRDRDYGGSSNGGGRYDAHQGGSNLMKKLGIAAESEKPANNDEEIEFPEDEKPSKIAAPPKKEEPKPSPVFTKPTGGAKFLPPPPSKSGAPVPNTSTPTSVSTSQASTNDGFDLLGADLLAVTPAATTPAQHPTQGSGLLGFDLTSPQPVGPAIQGNQFNLLGGTTPAQTQPFYGGANQSGASNLLGGQTGGFGYQPSGNGNLGGFGGNMGQNRQAFNGMQGGMNGQQPMGMQGGMGGNFGGMGSYGGQNMGMGGPQTGFGGMGGNQGFAQPQGSFGMGGAASQTSYGGSAQQSGKLITFDTKPSGSHDLLGGSQDNRPKTLDEIGLAGLADLSKITEEAKKQQTKKADNNSFNFGW